MKRYKRFIAATLVVVASILGYAGLASAHTFQASQNVTVNSAEQIRHTVFLAGNTVDVSAEVFGDVFCAGQTVTISGKIHGDVICAGQTVNVTGDVSGDVRLAGQSVLIAGKVGGNATVAGQSFSLASSGAVAGDVSLGSADGSFRGTVGRDIAAGGGNIEISNLVGRDITGMIENLKLANGTKVTGNISVTSRNAVEQAEGAQITGKISRTEPANEPQPKRGALFGFGIAWFMYWLVAMALVALVLVLLFPSFIHRTSQRTLSRPFKTWLIGLAATIVVPVAIVISFVTIIGIPLAIMMLLAWILVLLLSGPFFAYTLGRLVLRASTHSVKIMLVGAVILSVLYFVPIIGALAILAAVWFGSGMILLEAFHGLPHRAYQTSTDSNVSVKAKTGGDNGKRQR